MNAPQPLAPLDRLIEEAFVDWPTSASARATPIGFHQQLQCIATDCSALPNSPV